MYRRHFLAKSALTSLGFLALGRCSMKNSNQDTTSYASGLVKDPNQYLELPRGFQYKIISKAGDPMSDGLVVPGRPDGMGAFSNSLGECILVRNHENSPSQLKQSPFGPENSLVSKIDRKKLYDDGNLDYIGLGGTTTLTYDEENQEITSQFLSLAGTYRNCAGGVTPWNSWLSCEEDVTKVDGKKIMKNHGYVFDVPSDATGLVDPEPVVGMGRFNHEAIAVDPETHIIYQTEDRPDGLIYRYIPNDKANLHSGGKLQILAINDMSGFDTRNWDEITMKVGEKFPTTWLDIEDVQSPNDDLRYRGYQKGAARFARGEGMWYGDGEIFFACTNGGPGQFGQIFRYDLHSETLDLFAESPKKSVLHMCDNLTISPWGDILVCEDNGEENRMHIIDRKGDIRLFGINKSSDSEFAGAVFSPSGKTLFVNIQENGDTLAITGPWESLKS